MYDEDCNHECEVEYKIYFPMYHAFYKEKLLILQDAECLDCGAYGQLYVNMAKVDEKGKVAGVACLNCESKAIQITSFHYKD